MSIDVCWRVRISDVRIAEEMELRIGFKIGSKIRITDSMRIKNSNPRSTGSFVFNISVLQLRGPMTLSLIGRHWDTSLLRSNFDKKNTLTWLLR